MMTCIWQTKKTFPSVLSNTVSCVRKNRMRLKKWFKIGCIMLGIVSCGVFFSFMFIPLENLYNVCTNVSTFSRCDCITNVSKHLNQRSRNLLMNNLKDFPEEKCLMSIETKGRLGNLMGEYATLFALSRLNGRPAYIQEEMHKSLGKYFNISLPVLDKRLSKRIPWTVHVINDWMETKYSKFSGHFVKMDGYPCSWTFYHHIKDEVLREFTFHPPILDTVNKYLIEVRKNRTSVTYVGVHIRRGDYVELMSSLYDGVLADAEYFDEAMQKFRSIFQDALFIVCSDDLVWARNNLKPINNDIIFGWNGKSSSPGYDMALLSNCNHTIMSIGTFGYWSAYIAGGSTIYLANFTRPGSEFLKVFHYDSAFLPEWQGISVYIPPRSNANSCHRSYVLGAMIAICIYFLTGKFKIIY